MSEATRQMPPLRARRVRFDLADTPLHWVPGDAYTSHLINVLHLIVPVGERWFTSVLREALPHLKDAELRADVAGFVGQEAMHSHVHDAALAFLREHGIETEGFTQHLDAFLNGAYGGTQPPPGIPEKNWLLWRLALVAAAEQLTCMLGDWALDAEALDKAQADPVLLDMFRWHGSEEIEHCEVAFNALRELAEGWEYPYRVGGMAVAMPVLIGWWHLGLTVTTQQDPATRGRWFGLADYLVSAAQGRAPGWEILKSVSAYVRPDFHPAAEADFDKAFDYLKVSPAVRAARA